MSPIGTNTCLAASTIMDSEDGALLRLGETRLIDRDKIRNGSAVVRESLPPVLEKSQELLETDARHTWSEHNPQQKVGCGYPSRFSALALHLYGKPVTSYGHPEHTRLDMPRCGSIQWIQTHCEVHGLERQHG